MAEDYKYKLRDLASMAGTPINWNPQTRTVLVDNKPFDTTGWQNIDGRFTGTESMATNFLNTYKTPTPSGNIRGLPPRQAPVEQTAVVQRPSGNVADTSTPTPTPSYSSQINTLTNQLGEAVQGFGKPYDLSKDPVYEALAKYQQSQMLQMAGSRGMAMSENTKGRIAQNNMLLGQQFQQQDQLRQLQNIQNLQGQLGTMTGLEDRATQNQFTLEDRQFQQEDRSMNLEDRRLVRDQTIYGIALTPQTRDYMNTMQSLTPEQSQYVNQYSDNFAAEINNLPESSPRRKLLEAARFQKVIADPTQYREYLVNDYGLSPFQVDNIIMSKAIEDAKMNATDQKEQAEYDKLLVQIDKLNVELDREKEGLKEDEYNVAKAKEEAYKSKIEASNIDAKEKAELLKINAQISSSKASAEGSRASAESSRANTRLNDQKLIEQMNKYDPKVQALFTNWLGSGEDIGKWLNTEDNNGNTIGASLSLGQLQALVELGKETGSFGKSKSQIAELTDFFDKLGIKFKGGE